MASVFSSIVGSGVYLYMFSAFSGLGQRNIAKLAFTFVVLMLVNTFVHVSDPLNAIVYYTIIAAVYVSVFKVKYYATAIYIFIMFAIHYISAMFSTNLLIYVNRQIVDYRMAFKTDNLLYVAVLAIVACLLIYLVHRALRALVKYFEYIKDIQSSLYVLNSLLFLVLFVYLRLQIVTGTKVALIEGAGIAVLQIIQLIFVIGVFVWLMFTMNKHRILYTREMGQRNWKTIVELVANAKISKKPLSLIYAEFPYYDEFVKKYGSRRGSQIMDVVLGVARNTLDGAVIIKLRQNTLLFVLENCEEYRAIQQKEDFIKEYRNKVSAINDPNVARLLVGASKFDPIRHADYRSFMYSAQEQAYI